MRPAGCFIPPKKLHSAWIISAGVPEMKRCSAAGLKTPQGNSFLFSLFKLDRVLEQPQLWLRQDNKTVAAMDVLAPAIGEVGVCQKWSQHFLAFRQVLQQLAK